MTNSENETVSLLEAIYLSTSDAPKALARIAMYIAINPERVLKLNVTDLAQQTGSGKASIVRYCQTLGYSGFREFKIALSGEIERDRTRRLASRPETTISNADTKISRIHRALQNSLEDTAQLLRIDQIERLTQRLQTAKRIELFGIGVSHVCADLLAIRLIWLGIQANSSNAPTLSYGLASTLDQSDLAIGISYSGVSEETQAFLTTARDAGAYTIAITTREKCPVAAVADELLLLSSSGPWPEAGSARLMPPIVLLSECIAQCLHPHPA